MKNLVTSICMMLTFVAAAASSAGEFDDSRIGEKIADFTLRDSYGTQRSLADSKDKSVMVVAFLGNECPLAKLYGGRLAALHEEYSSRGVGFVGINSNLQDTMTEISAYVERHEIPFPVLKDPGNEVADRFGASRTPQVFVLDDARVIRYQGRIDDQYIPGGKIRDKATRADLAIAIEEVLAGNPVTQPITEADGCIIGRVKKSEPRGEINFASHIAPILNARCVECHRPGEIAPFTLTSFEDVQGWGEMIVEVIDENRMPPWNANPKFGHFSNDARLSDREKELIRNWVANGMPPGSDDDLPEPPTFVKGWRIPKPDLVVSLPEPFDVPAQGVVDYQYFSVDPGFDEDKYICAAECRPGNREVVHHIIAYIKPPGARRFREFGWAAGYAPGSPPTRLEEGMAIRIPAGSTFVFEMHYTPNGTAQTDQSGVGLKFVDQSKVKKLVDSEMALNEEFRIPPGDGNFEVTAQRHIKRDVDLISLSPHMHLRGKSFRYEAFYPDGKSEILLDVPQYDFNWQLTYILQHPKRLPRGTRIVCTAHFDNSESNPVNPDPTRTVRWGDQSWDEMMIGFFDVIPAEPSGE